MKITRKPLAFVLTLVMILSVLFGSVFQVSAAAPAWPTVQSGSSGANVYALQYLINYWGYNTITVDGDFGSNTTTAVKNFQTKKGLTSDGIVGTNSWTALTNVTQKTSSYSANATKAIQYLLKNKYGMSSLAVDGAFGSGTESAVKSFQTANSITADGSVGPATWQYLVGAGKSPAASSSYSNMSLADLAKEILKRSNIKFTYDASAASGRNDGANAYNCMVSTSKGEPAKLSAYKANVCPGGTVYLSKNLLISILMLNDKYGQIGINCLADGHHSSGSNHYKGIAADFSYVGSYNSVSQPVGDNSTITTFLKGSGFTLTDWSGTFYNEGNHYHVAITAYTP